MHTVVSRRRLLESLGALAPVAAFPWDSLPDAPQALSGDAYDAVVIGSGLGGLSAAAAFARKGYRALVLEQHDKPGGYATAFRRPGGFSFDVSLHSTGAGERNGVRNLIGGLPEITEVEFVPHPHLYRAIFPNHDIRVPQRDIPAYIRLLADSFPEERPGVEALIADMRAMNAEIGRLSRVAGKMDMRSFPQEFPTLYKHSDHTWGQMVDSRLRDPKLKAIFSALWVYYGLPPAKLSSYYYALPTLGYLEGGGYYPKGRSQAISNALVKFIEARGGKLLLKTRVEKIMVQDGAATGVRCAGGREFRARAVISNASAPQTFETLLGDSPAVREYRSRLAGYSTSLSCFQIFLGLRRDLAGQLGVKDSEIFLEPGYDPEASYEAMGRAAVEHGAVAVTIYDNLYPGYSPKGKNTLNILTLQGFGHWEQFERDYRAGRKAAYRAEKERMASILIQRVDQALLPGLANAIEVKEIGTPLTNLRYTGNTRGAIYGWDQTVSNSGNRRVGHATTVKNLYLAGAWSEPGHGYGAVLASGPNCFAEVIRRWA
jgi:all-trans-retinol 13,14-reductase